MSTELDLAAIRERLAKATGRTFWRSLNELADNDAWRELLEREFPRQAMAMDGVMDRRSFLKVAGASLALAGLTGCAYGIRQPREKILPYVRMPENVIPGKPLFYATTLTFQGYAIGTIAETHEGRPTKLEGNPDHPASLGGSSIFHQASLLTMYDPERSQNVLNKGQTSSYDAFKQALAPLLEAKRGAGGAGMALLTGTVTSPTLASQIQGLLAALPQAKWYQYEPVNGDNARAGAIQAFGEYVNTVYDFSKARIVVSLDGDFLGAGPAQIRYARDFAARRRPQTNKEQTLRLYVAESTPSLTGSNADHRLPLPAGQVETIARALAAAVGVATAPAIQGLPDAQQRWVTAAAQDLRAARGASIVVAGEWQPPAVHALAHAINAALGNVGQTVSYIEPVEAGPVEHTAALRELTQAMDGGQVDLLVILGANPAYSAPADINFAGALSKVATSIHLGLYADETAARSTWHIPETHELEQWGDARAFDGTTSIIQPMIAPLYGGKSAYELLALLSGKEASGYEVVRGFWQGRGLGGDFERAWKETLRKGVIDNTAAPAKQVAVRSGFDTPTQGGGGAGFTLVIRPDPTIYDGRFANNGWLQELPKPLSKVDWDNYVALRPGDAEALGVRNGDVVELRAGGRSVRGPVWILPGQSEKTATITLGYGRQNGLMSNGIGFNAYQLRSAAAPWFTGGLEIVKTGERYDLVTSQDTQSMKGREIVRTATLEEFLKDPAEALHIEKHKAISLYPEKQFQGVQWGMTIDLNACIGCGACTVACQAENNIPVVGKDQVGRGRIMHWIRVDRYYEGTNLDEPATYHMPVPCMQCENAPCESVCPVAATVHSADGLNQMVYNRCVGTKYCSNNCPYKVRRFNFYQYNDETSESLKLMRNPNVTVRSRGVMEKCTYCVQRIAAARQTAEAEGRALKDGDVLTACQQACPTQAIVFGNINDPASAVSKSKAEPLNYGLFAEELNTRPRTSYLGRISNPNPTLVSEG
jgi:molybdopterin-containing oxidoreductase family iron-sulfur binding subunit